MGSQIEDGRGLSCSPAPARLLRQRLEAGQFILAPGVFDGLSARVALEVGFDTLYMVRYVTKANSVICIHLLTNK